MAGPAPAKARARPVLEAMGAHGIFDFGEAFGAALTVKLVGNFLIISAGRSMTEALAMAMAEQAGVDPKPIVEMLTTTLFAAPIYQSYGKRLVDKAAAFGASMIPEKDLGLFQETARPVGAPTPIADLLRELVRT